MFAISRGNIASNDMAARGIYLPRNIFSVVYTPTTNYPTMSIAQVGEFRESQDRFFAQLAEVHNSPQSVLQRLQSACSVAATDSQMSSYNEDSARHAPASLADAQICADEWERLVATRSTDDADHQQLEWRRSGLEGDLLAWRQHLAAECLASIAQAREYAALQKLQAAQALAEEDTRRADAARAKFETTRVHEDREQLELCEGCAASSLADWYRAHAEYSQLVSGANPNRTNPPD